MTSCVSEHQECPSAMGPILPDGSDTLSRAHHMTLFGGSHMELAGQWDGNLGKKLLSMMESTTMKRLSQMFWTLVGGTRFTTHNSVPVRSLV